MECMSRHAAVYYGAAPLLPPYAPLRPRAMLPLYAALAELCATRHAEHSERFRCCAMLVICRRLRMARRHFTIILRRARRAAAMMRCAVASAATRSMD